MKTNRWTSNWSEAAGPLGRVAVCAGAGLLVFGTVSCGTSTATRPAPGAALIDASPGWHPQSRMKNSRVLSVNGVDAVGREANVAVGLTQVKLRYNWPQGGAQEVNLKFRARSDRKYSVKYAAFPPSVDQLSGTTMLSTSAEGFADAAYRVMGETRGNAAGGALGVAIIAPAILLGTIDYWHRVGKSVLTMSSAVTQRLSEILARAIRRV